MISKLEKQDPQEVAREMGRDEGIGRIRARDTRLIYVELHQDKLTFLITSLSDINCSNISKLQKLLRSTPISRRRSSNGY